MSSNIFAKTGGSKSEIIPPWFSGAELCIGHGHLLEHIHNTFGVLVSGDNRLPNMGVCPPGSGLASPLLDGLRCVGGAALRHGSRATDANGEIGTTSTAGWGPPNGPAPGIGQHAGFSRVVLELDSAVGYKVERTTPTSGADEWVISLDAGAKPRSVHRRFDFIESVEIVPTSGTRSTVRVRLRGEDLKLSEMILANPPRIVVDVMGPTEPTATSRARAPGAKPIAVVAAESKQPAPKATAKLAKKKSSTSKYLLY